MHGGSYLASAPMSISKSLNNSAYSQGRSMSTTSAELRSQKGAVNMPDVVNLQGDADVAFGHVASHVTTSNVSSRTD